MVNHIEFSYEINESSNGEKASLQLSWIQSNIKRVSEKYGAEIRSDLRSENKACSGRNPYGICLNITIESEKDLAGVLEELLNEIALEPLPDLGGTESLHDVVNSYKSQKAMV